MAETSDDVSSIAARLVRISTRDIARIATSWDGEQLPALARDIRKVAASALRQDETPRSFWHRRFGWIGGGRG